MDPITIGLMALNFVDKQQQRKKQNALDQVEAKWSGFKNYEAFKPGGGTGSALTDATQAVGWYQALDKAEAAKKLAAKSQGQKAMQVDETEAAANFRGPPSSLKGSEDPPEIVAGMGMAPTDQQGYADDDNLYMRALGMSKQKGGSWW